MIGLKRGTVKLLPHNPIWLQLFEEEKARLLQALGDKIIDIQHIGSTSIPGIVAKPIIDISVGIKSMKNSHQFIPLLEALGYEYRPNFGGPNIQLMFVKGEEKSRTHYLHLMKYNGQIWQDDILFREFLRRNPKRAKEYANLKQELAKQFADDRTRYTASKADFIKETLKIAKNNLDQPSSAETLVKFAQTAKQISTKGKVPKDAVENMDFYTWGGSKRK